MLFTVIQYYNCVCEIAANILPVVATVLPFAADIHVYVIAYHLMSYHQLLHLTLHVSDLPFDSR